MCVTNSLADVTRKLYLLVVALLVCAQLERQTYELANPRISLLGFNYGLVSRT